MNPSTSRLSRLVWSRTTRLVMRLLHFILTHTNRSEIRHCSPVVLGIHGLPGLPPTHLGQQLEVIDIMRRRIGIDEACLDISGITISPSTTIFLLSLSPLDTKGTHRH